MGATAFLVLFVLGFLLAVVGWIVGLVDAFQVSPAWGVLSLLVVPLVVYCIKFWGRKWARNSLITLLGGLGVMLLSTPLLGSFLAQRAGQIGTGAEEAVPAEGALIEPVPVPTEQAAAEEEFAQPLVAVAPQLSSVARADLIQSTDPNERLQQINNSRSDPFAAVPIPPPPRVVAPPTPPRSPAPTAATPARATASGGAGGGRATPGSSARAPVAAAPQAPASPAPGGSSAGRASTSPGSGASGGSQAAKPPSLAPLPALPKPTLAEAVLVTGVMTIGSENFAVVETSAGSQYVKAGQRVANGQVLVKRIDLRGSDPIVVLEQNGIEVSRPVGAPASATVEPSV
ncbi:MAG: hypothetical protein WBB18_12195 [Nodosilinea sp.]